MAVVMPPSKKCLWREAAVAPRFSMAEPGMREVLCLNCIILDDSVIDIRLPCSTSSSYSTDRIWVLTAGRYNLLCEDDSFEASRSGWIPRTEWGSIVPPYGL